MDNGLLNMKDLLLVVIAGLAGSLISVLAFYLYVSFLKRNRVVTKWYQAPAIILSYIVLWGLLGVGVAVWVVEMLDRWMGVPGNLSFVSVLVWVVALVAFYYLGRSFDKKRSQAAEASRATPQKPISREKFNTQRRRAILVMVGIILVMFGVLAGCYFTAAERMRNLYLYVGLVLIGGSLCALAGLIWVYHQISKTIDKDE